MEQVDDSLNAKIQGERFRVTYGDQDPYTGAENPLVTIVEFSDFQCPFCSKFGDMLHEVVKDPAYANDLRIVFKQFPLPMHKDAQMAPRRRWPPTSRASSGRCTTCCSRTRRR
jgi:protein-disulfide isomerase